MRRHLLAISASALALAVVPSFALGAQDNTAAANAAAGNSATSVQLGGGGDQTATNTQLLPIAVAPAVAPQVAPVNLNLPISVASTGGGGSVDQSNTAAAFAAAVLSCAPSAKDGTTARASALALIASRWRRI